jgi:hypothetical protein
MIPLVPKMGSKTHTGNFLENGPNDFDHIIYNEELHKLYGSPNIIGIIR